jgi:hypothetical protein
MINGKSPGSDGYIKKVGQGPLLITQLNALEYNV